MNNLTIFTPMPEINIQSVLRYVKRVVLVGGILMVLISGCKKKEDKPKYLVTYTITNDATSYYLQIYDAANKNDWADSIKANHLFVKTISYDYMPGSWNVQIDNAKGKPSHKKIEIKFERTVICQDTLFPSLSCSYNN